MHDLGLGLRHEDEDWPERPRRTRPRRWLGLVVLTLAVAGLLAGLGAGVHAVVQALTPASNDYAGPGSGSVIVVIQPGDPISVIADVLAGHGVVRTPSAFDAAAATNGRAMDIQPGYYKMRRHMKASLALALLLQPSARITSRVVVFEGATLTELLTAVAAGTHIPVPKLRAAADHPVGLGLPSYCDGSVAGCLFPATYVFPPNSTADGVLGAMVARFRQEAAALNLVATAAAQHRSPRTVITIASILEREVNRPADYATVAEVIDNRLARGMHLQLDSTVAYADAVGNQAYNTYTHAGLPPGPISFPGQLALTAALHPAHGSYLFFVTIDSAGHTAYARTYAGQQANIAIAKRNGVFKH